MDGYISKPIRTHELFAAIESVMDKCSGRKSRDEAPGDDTADSTKRNVTEFKGKF
jgi:DNA-binding response OmpR family regulator